MAIAFARREPISRNKGGNAVRSAAYAFGTTLIDRRTGSEHSFDKHTGIEHTEVLLPEGAHPMFLDPAILFSALELAEVRKDARVGYEMVLALPQDPEITRQDRIELARSFVQEHFLSKGSPVLLALHTPHKNAAEQADTQNFHAHIIHTTRRLSGTSFERRKAADLLPRFFKIGGRAMAQSEEWRQKWEQHQNAYFQRLGLTLRVDPCGQYPQQHLGPKRHQNPRDPRIHDNIILAELNLRAQMKEANTHVRELKNKIYKADATIQRQRVKLAEAKAGLKHVGVARKLLHRAGVYGDPTIRKWTQRRNSAERTIERWSILRKHAMDNLPVAVRLAASLAKRAHQHLGGEVPRQEQVQKHSRRSTQTPRQGGQRR